MSLAELITPSEPSLLVPLVQSRVTARGARPCTGEEWQNIVRSFSAEGADDEELRKRRITALVRIKEAFEAAFLAKAGKDADASQWVLIVLEGWWLRQTTTPATVCPAKVYLDCTYAFILKSKWESQCHRK